MRVEGILVVTIKSCKDDILQHRGLTLCYDRAMRKTYWNPVIGLPLAKARYLAGKKPEGAVTGGHRGVTTIVFVCNIARFPSKGIACYWKTPRRA